MIFSFCNIETKACNDFDFNIVISGSNFGMFEGFLMVIGAFLMGFAIGHIWKTILRL
nr:MAG TPA: hypothetical protein [Inoviridae sp.]